MLESLGKGWNLLVEDESIFIPDSVLSKKKKWIIREKRPTVIVIVIVIVIVTGSHEKTFVYGVLSLDDKQLYRRQNERFDSQTCIGYLDQVRMKFKKFVMIVDKANQYRSKMVEEYL